MPSLGGPILELCVNSLGNQPSAECVIFLDHTRQSKWQKLGKLTSRLLVEKRAGLPRIALWTAEVGIPLQAHSQVLLVSFSFLAGGRRLRLPTL